MAASSDSNDASDIFWPGYVDAISNLAINLLFVIAVMCIVILSFVLEETTKGKPQEGDAPLATQSAAQNPSLASPVEGDPITASLQAENAKLKQELKVLQKVAQSSAAAKAELSASVKSSTAQSSAPASASSGTSQASSQQNNVANPTPKMEVVNAKQEVIKDEKGMSNMTSVGAGVLVNFDPKVISLSPDESKDVFDKLQSYGSPKSTRWQITVISPKGFTESARLAYYRAVAVRNVLIQNGVPGDQIQMRVLESNQPGANNARVTINPAP